MADSSKGALRFGCAVGVTASRGQVPRATRTAQQQLEAFCTALGDAIGRIIEPIVTGSYHELQDAMDKGEVHVAWMAPVIALRSVSVGKAVPLALPIRGGVSTFHTALFTLPDSAFKDELDLFGARAAWVDADSAAGYLVIRAAMRSRGLGFERAFKTETFVGSHDAVVKAVEDGDADVGATFVHFDATGNVLRSGWGKREMHMISHYGPIPADLITCSSRLPGSDVRALEQALVVKPSGRVSSSAAVFFEAEKFAEATSAHLQPLSALLRYLDDSPRRWGSMVPPAS